MDDYDTRSLVDAKEEFTKELITTLQRHFFEGIESIFEEAVDKCKDDPDDIFTTFQDLLSEIPNWNPNIIERETNRIVECSECEYLEELITAVFIGHTKIMASIRVNKKNKKINLKIPKLDYFIHKCYINIAREFWRVPYYFNKNIPNVEIQKHVKLSEDLITKCIGNTIRKLLPLKHILQESLGDDYDDDSDDSNLSDAINTSSTKNKTKKLPNKSIEKESSEQIEEFQNNEENEETDNILQEIDLQNLDVLNEDEMKEINLQQQEVNSIEKINTIDTKKKQSEIEHEEQLKRISEEEEAKAKEEEEAKAKEEEEAKAKEEEEAKAKEEEEAKAKEEEEAKANEEAETKANEEAETKAQKEKEARELVEQELIKKQKEETSIIKTNISNNANDDDDDDDDDDDAQELDLNSLMDGKNILKLDNNFNIVDLNSDNNIKNEVMNDLNIKDNNQSKKPWSFFEDAPDLETS